jgi:hypothetical protein
MSDETKRCACGLQSDVERFSPGHGPGMCLVEGKWIDDSEFQKPARDLVAAALRHAHAHEKEKREHEGTQGRLRSADEERASEWRRAERWERAAVALARIVSGDDSAPDERPPAMLRWRDVP